MHTEYEATCQKRQCRIKFRMNQSYKALLHLFIAYTCIYIFLFEKNIIYRKVY